MLEITQRYGIADRYYIRLVDATLDEFKRYVAAVDKFPNKVLDQINLAWVVDKKTAIAIKDEMENGDVCSSMKLKPFAYQRQGIAFGLKTQNVLYKLPCGAGKTYIGIALISELEKTAQQKQVSAVIVKATLKTQWHKEVSKFTDLRPVVIKTYAQTTQNINAKINARKKKLQQELKQAHKNTDAVIALRKEIKSLEKEAIETFNSQFDINKYDVLILNYETLADDKTMEELLKLDLGLMYVDEIDMIKDQKSKRSKNICKFAHVPNRFGATATPIRKNPQDIYGIFKFIKPELFPSFKIFNDTFVKFDKFHRPCGSKNEALLTQTIEPYIFSRSLGDISDQLPEQPVIQLHCNMTPEQERMNELIQSEINALKDANSKIVNMLGPYKAKENPEYVKNENGIIARQTFAQMLANSEELLGMSDSGMAKRYITGGKSAKVELCVELIQKIAESNEKVCIFSRFLGVQTILKRELDKVGIESKAICGAMSDPERNKIVSYYNDSESCNVLMLSDAGEAGLNLSTTKYMIEFELADSAAKQTQRHGRNRRANSIHDKVFVYQLIADNSFDEIAQKIVNKKEKYEQDILAGI